MRTSTKAAGALIVATILFIALIAWLVKVKAPNLLIGILICLLLLFINRYLTRTTKVVLWLRKFNSGNDKFKPEKFFLSGKYCVFTLQDESYPFSPMDFLYNHPLLYAFSVTVGMPLLFFVAYLPFFVLLPASVKTSFWFIGAFIAVFGVFVRYIGLSLARKIHTTRVRSAEDISKISLLARGIKVHGAAPFPKVFACVNSKWQELVINMVDIADVIFIDLSEVTEHMRWEIRTAIVRRPAHKIVLLVETGNEPEWTRTNLGQTIFGDTSESNMMERFRAVKIVKYNGHRDLSRDILFGVAREKHRAISSALKNQIDDAMKQ